MSQIKKLSLYLEAEFHFYTCRGGRPRKQQTAGESRASRLSVAKQHLKEAQKSNWPLGGGTSFILSPHVSHSVNSRVRHSCANALVDVQNTEAAQSGRMYFCYCFVEVLCQCLPPLVYPLWWFHSQYWPPPPPSPSSSPLRGAGIPMETVSSAGTATVSLAKTCQIQPMWYFVLLLFLWISHSVENESLLPPDSSHRYTVLFITLASRC